MTQSTTARQSNEPGWPAVLPEPDVTFAGGRLGLLQRPGRRQGAVRLYWQPPSPSRFWSERGALSTMVGAVLNTPWDGARSLATELETRGVATQVSESEFFCFLDLAGDRQELLACVARVADALARRCATPEAISAAGRRFVQQRRTHYRRPLGAAEAQQWREYATSPDRLSCDYAVDGRPGAPPHGLADSDWPALAGIIVVGPRQLATAWAAAIDALGPPDGTATDLPQVTLARPAETTVLPVSNGSQTLITYGAIETPDDERPLFELELAIEILAGWSGSLLNQLFRHELAWSYGVRGDARIACVGDQTVLSWSIFLQTAPERARSVLEHIRNRIRLVLESRPTDTEVRRAARRILRRELLWEDSVTEIMSRHGEAVQSGLPSLATRRRHHFITSAGAGSLVRGLERMLRTGTFIVVGDHT